MAKLFNIKKPPVRSHDYRVRKYDRRKTDGRDPRYLIEMTEHDLDQMWKRIPAQEKSKLINDWLAGRW